MNIEKANVERTSQIMGEGHVIKRVVENRRGRQKTRGQDYKEKHKLDSKQISNSSW